MLKYILRSLPAVAAVAAVVGLSSAPANAVPVDITYNLTTVDFFSTTAGANTLTGTGTLTVRFSNGTLGGHVSGTGTLNVQSGTLALNGNFTVLGGVLSFTGFQNVTFPGAVGGEGMVTAGGAFNLDTVGHIVSGSNHCAGSCSLAMLTASVTSPLTSGPRGINLSNGIVAGFPSLGLQSFTGTGITTGGGNVLTLTIVGQEVSRTVVPEPGTGVLLGLGLAGLGLSGGALGARRRR